MVFMKISFSDLKLSFILCFLFLCSSCSIEKLTRIKQQAKSPYEQITFIELMKKYVDKEPAEKASIEGIYSVSASATKKSKGLFSTTEKERTLDQKENYAMVAIISDKSKNNREFIEIPIDKGNQYSYPVRGEFTTLADGNILMLKHFEPKGKILSYSLIFDAEKNMLEGIRTETSGSATYTYKLTFLKVYPKSRK
jgi:hypothetical protein